jgi:serine protease Do
LRRVAALCALCFGVLTWVAGCDLSRSFPGTSRGEAQAVVPVKGPDTVILPGGVQAPASFADLAERVSPAVVFIETHQTGRRGARRVVGQGLGSGFIFDESGLIVTNHHVVANATRIEVVVGKERRLRAEVIGSDAPSDIAVLKVPLTGLPTLSLGDSGALRVGDWVLAIGNPFGLANTVSAGIVSAKGRTRQDVPGLDPMGYYDFIQTDASINPGNSGGPLLDLAGQVVGVNTAINSQANNIGFAIPVNIVRELLPSLLGKGEVERSAIGVTVAALKPEDLLRLGIDDSSGALVTVVTKNGPGERGGLRLDDVIIGVNGKPVAGPEALRWVISIAGVGNTVQLSVRRERRLLSLEVLLEPAKAYLP